MAVLLSEILVAIVVGIIVAHFFKKQFNKETLLSLLCYITIAGIIAGCVVNLLPILTEKVIITALNDKNELSSENQIALASIIVDGKEYTLQNASEGKWFWRGDYYWWRPENDSRRPNGLTETIVIEVPIGVQRMVGFDSWTNRGIVEIISGEKKEILDTYGEKANTIIYTELESTKLSKVILFKFFKLAIFAMMMLMICSTFMLARRDNGKMSKWFEKNWDKLTYFACALIMFCISILLSGKQSFWGDEVHNLVWAHWETFILPFSELVRYNLTFNDATPPLFNILEHVWLHIVPYGQEWALLLPEVITAIGIYFIGLTANKLRGKIAGIIAAILACFSAPIYIQCCLELRAYCLLMTISAIVLYVYVLRYQSKMKNIKYEILYGVLMAVLLYSHYYGVLICGLLFLADLVLFLNKNAKLNNGISYIIAGISFLPWVGAVLKTATYNPFERTWNSVPTLSTYVSTMKYLSGNIEIVAVVFLIAGIYFFVSSLEKMILSRHISGDEFIYIVLALVPFVLVSVMFIYSAYIKPDGSKWHSRYFVCVIPFLIVSVASFIDKIMDNISKKNVVNVLIVCLFIIGYYGLNSIGYVINTQVPSSSQHLYREAAEYIMEQNDVYDSSTVALITLGGYEDVVVGWEYYLTHGGKKDKINSYSGYSIDEATLCKYKTVYLFVAYNISEPLKKMLDDNFNQINFDRNTNVYKYVRKH